ncbi:MAG: NAD(P)H quinone oxidoreductase [Blastomonas sp. CACIA14H2]|uniref:NAD(P)H-quinone oxidoreductase n=1 Tax=Blastomonas sp. CACIA14H2 TaxID=1419876 RepID=UPI0003D0597E|nr:MAG: NAD(P)H quinone oxidoreductase [Blastomonas sp. CACIA14H2]
MNHGPIDMQAVEFRPDGPGFIAAVTRRRVPVAGPGEVLIAVHAAGVNGHDIHQLHAGGHPLRPGETDIPGLEVSGEIVALGEGVSRWSVGDRVCALLRGGGYAEYAIAPEGSCFPKPANLGWVEAAALPETYCTVWSNVFIDGALGADETFLMNGGTSGIGVASIQIAHALGRRVFATARGAQKARQCEALGATRGIDYETEDFAEVVMASTDNRGVDVILDIVAGDYLSKDLGALAEGGRLVFIGGARGFSAELDIRKLMRKRLRVMGSLLRPRPDAFKARVVSELVEHVWPHVCAGRIDPMIDRSFMLADAASAIAHVEGRHHIGKVVLEVKPQ